MNIPKFPSFKPLDKEDRPVFLEYFAHYKLNLAEYAFSNIFIWRDIDETQITQINNNICLLVMSSDKNKYFMMPLGDSDIAGTIETCLSYSNEIIRLSSDFIDLYAAKIPNLVIEEDRNSFDYVYLTKDLIELKGRKYDGKRNHINNFLKNYEFQYETLTESHIEECLSLNELWYNQKVSNKADTPSIFKYERHVVNEAFKYINFLGLRGGIIKIDGKIEAFSLGEKLNSDTAVIYIEKTNPEIRGISQIINREFISHEWADTIFINREQDLGYPGLRKAKLSYQPNHFEKKYNISYKL